MRTNGIEYKAFFYALWLAVVLKFMMLLTD